MKLTIHNLASGSRGNCTIVSNGHTYIMIDAGLTKKTIVERSPIPLKDISALLITHEHADHIKGTSCLSSAGIPIYAPEACIPYIVADSITPIKEATFLIGDIEVTPFRVPHDATYTVGYTFAYDGEKIGIATDLGCLTNAIVNHFVDCDMALIESNHDIDMLKHGTYPEHLKNRILSNNGHLSNDQSASFVTYLAEHRLRKVMLGHLSEHNNTPELARTTLETKLASKGQILDIYIASEDHDTYMN